MYKELDAVFDEETAKVRALFVKNIDSVDYVKETDCFMHAFNSDIIEFLGNYLEEKIEEGSVKDPSHVKGLFEMLMNILHEYHDRYDAPFNWNQYTVAVYGKLEEFYQEEK